ncbi:uncharacterized protein LOC124439208 [Xenia sp. Carnegie-2017]|uniref:uncharacterized protein LOC124439208 n=1 Tax=Xenia sp. Carnegie-2017 TaxID=2897299 RepID=UPI001F0493A3|nr:uncharacterized protein LOC124439208 [Xenia sp. Carnegie-2017]
MTGQGECSESIDLMETDSEDEESFSERQSDVEFLNDIDHSDSELSFYRQIDNQVYSRDRLRLFDTFLHWTRLTIIEHDTQSFLCDRYVQTGNSDDNCEPCNTSTLYRQIWKLS